MWLVEQLEPEWPHVDSVLPQGCTLGLEAQRRLAGPGAGSKKGGLCPLTRWSCTVSAQTGHSWCVLLAKLVSQTLLPEGVRGSPTGLICPAGTEQQAAYHCPGDRGLEMGIPRRRAVEMAAW